MGYLQKLLKKNQDCPGTWDVKSSNFSLSCLWSRTGYSNWPTTYCRLRSFSGTSLLKFKMFKYSDLKTNLPEVAFSILS